MDPIGFGRRTGKPIQKVKNINSSRDNFSDYLTDSDIDQTLDLTKWTPLPDQENVQSQLGSSNGQSADGKVNDNLCQNTGKATEQFPSLELDKHGHINVSENQAKEKDQVSEDFAFNPFQNSINVGRRTGKRICKLKNVDDSQDNFSDYLSDTDANKSLDITRVSAATAPESLEVLNSETDSAQVCRSNYVKILQEQDAREDSDADDSLSSKQAISHDREKTLINDEENKMEALKGSTTPQMNTSKKQDVSGCDLLSNSDEEIFEESRQEGNVKRDLSQLSSKGQKLNLSQRCGKDGLREKILRKSLAELHIVSGNNFKQQKEIEVDNDSVDKLSLPVLADDSPKQTELHTDDEVYDVSQKNSCLKSEGVRINKHDILSQAHLDCKQKDNYPTEILDSESKSRNSGADVQQPVIDKAVSYVDECPNQEPVNIKQNENVKRSPEKSNQYQEQLNENEIKNMKSAPKSKIPISKGIKVSSIKSLTLSKQKSEQKTAEFGKFVTNRKIRKRLKKRLATSLRELAEMNAYDDTNDDTENSEGGCPLKDIVSRKESKEEVKDDESESSHEGCSVMKNISEKEQEEEENRQETNKMEPKLSSYIENVPDSKTVNVYKTTNTYVKSISLSANGKALHLVSDSSPTPEPGEKKKACYFKKICTGDNSLLGNHCPVTQDSKNKSRSSSKEAFSGEEKELVTSSVSSYLTSASAKEGECSSTTTISSAITLKDKRTKLTSSSLNFCGSSETMDTFVKPRCASTSSSLNFGGDITGSVSNTEKVSSGQFFGIKKRLSYSKALVGQSFQQGKKMLSSITDESKGQTFVDSSTAQIRTSSTQFVSIKSSKDIEMDPMKFIDLSANDSSDFYIVEEEGIETIGTSKSSSHIKNPVNIKVKEVEHHEQKQQTGAHQENSEDYVRDSKLESSVEGKKCFKQKKGSRQQEGSMPLVSDDKQFKVTREDHKIKPESHAVNTLSKNRTKGVTSANEKICEENVEKAKNGIDQASIVNSRLLRGKKREIVKSKKDVSEFESEPTKDLKASPELQVSKKMKPFSFFNDDDDSSCSSPGLMMFSTRASSGSYNIELEKQNDLPTATSSSEEIENTESKEDDYDSDLKPVKSNKRRRGPTQFQTRVKKQATKMSKKRSIQSKKALEELLMEDSPGMGYITKTIHVKADMEVTHQERPKRKKCTEKLASTVRVNTEEFSEKETVLNVEEETLKVNGGKIDKMSIEEDVERKSIGAVKKNLDERPFRNYPKIYRRANSKVQSKIHKSRDQDLEDLGSCEKSCRNKRKTQNQLPESNNRELQQNTSNSVECNLEREDEVHLPDVDLSGETDRDRDGHIDQSTPISSHMKMKCGKKLNKSRKTKIKMKTKPSISSTADKVSKKRKKRQSKFDERNTENSTSVSESGGLPVKKAKNDKKNDKSNNEIYDSRTDASIQKSECEPLTVTKNPEKKSKSFKTSKIQKRDKPTKTRQTTSIQSSPSILSESSESPKQPSSDDRHNRSQSESMDLLSPVRLRLLQSLPAVTPQSGPSYRWSRAPFPFFNTENSPFTDLTKSTSTSSLIDQPDACNVLNSPLSAKLEPSPPKSCLRVRNSKTARGKRQKVRISSVIERLEISPSFDKSLSEMESTALPSMSSSPLHYARLAQDYEETSSSGISVPDLSHKIIRPDDAPVGLRRSRRTRVQRLRDFLGETIVYRRDSTGFGLVVDSIRPSLGEAKLLAQEAKRKEKLRRKKLKPKKVPVLDKTKRLSTHAPINDMDTTVNMRAPIVDYNSQEATEVGMIASRRDIYWLDLLDNGIAVGTKLNHPDFNTGEINMGPFTVKPGAMTINTILFNILHGKLLLTVDEKSSTVETGDDFFVPKGASYSLKNLRNDVARINFTNLIVPSQN